jgi:hypothetical protein
MSGVRAHLLFCWSWELFILKKTIDIAIAGPERALAKSQRNQFFRVTLASGCIVTTLKQMGK